MNPLYIRGLRNGSSGRDDDQGSHLEETLRIKLMFVNEEQVEIARLDQKHIPSGRLLPSQGTAEDWAIQRLGIQIARTEKAIRTIRARVYCAAAYYCC